MLEFLLHLRNAEQLFSENVSSLFPGVLYSRNAFKLFRIIAKNPILDALSGPVYTKSISSFTIASNVILQVVGIFRKEAKYFK